MKHGKEDGELKGEIEAPKQSNLRGVKKQISEEGEGVDNEQIPETGSPKKSSQSSAQFKIKERLAELRKALASSPQFSSSSSTHALCGGGKGWEKHRVSELGVWYLPEVISAEAEVALTDHIYSAPPSRWVQLRRRRLQVWGGYPKQDGCFTKEALPPWLAELCRFLKDLGVYGAKAEGGGDQGRRGEEKRRQERGAQGIDDELGSFNPNHVLINEYLPGQGIMAHQDGPKYRPFVAILSLGSHTVFHFYETIADSRNRSDGKACTAALELLLQPRSLLVFSQSAYKSLLHGIVEREVDLITDATVSGGSVATVGRRGASKSGIGIGSELQKQSRRSALRMKRGKRLSLTIREAFR